MSDNKSIRIVIEGLDAVVRVSPPIWPGKQIDCQPGDLSRIAPMGTGIYGYQEPIPSPFKAAPPHEDVGGVIFFASDISQEDFFALARILHIGDHKDYAVFLGASDNPKKDGFLHQIRIVSKFALKYCFGAIIDQEYDSFPDQTLTMSELMWQFLESQRKVWGSCMGSPAISGKFGGDGYWAIEELAFGMMVENDYHRIYRLWSRAWLVTK